MRLLHELYHVFTIIIVQSCLLIHEVGGAGKLLWMLVMIGIVTCLLNQKSGARPPPHRSVEPPHKAEEVGHAS